MEALNVWLFCVQLLLLVCDDLFYTNLKLDSCYKD
jgi:hypothetical protein